MVGVLYLLILAGGVIAFLVEIFYPWYKAEKELKEGQTKTKEYVRRYFGTEEKDRMFLSMHEILARLEVAEEEDEWDVDELYPLVKPLVETFELQHLYEDELINKEDYRRICKVLNEWESVYS